MASQTAPTIDAAGIRAPQFADILTWLKDQYRAIYGADVYLAADSQDGQFLALVAAAINDSNTACIEVYNSFSPATAQGHALSLNVKLNGIRRLVPTASTVGLLLGGTVGTTITGGLVTDADGTQWRLPATVTIPGTGSITVTATCVKLGAIKAAAGTITKIATPTYGWQTVTNPSAAVPGSPVETDAALRVRQSRSVAVPSQSIFEGIVGSVANLAGVTRLRGYENDSDTPDANGVPGHHIALIVEGGDVAAIANTIAIKKTPGTGTAGDVVRSVADAFGGSHIIRFSRPTVANIKINMTIQALTGYSSAILPRIRQAIAGYLNGLSIGKSVLYSKLFVPANLGNDSVGMTYAITAMTVARDAGAYGTSNVVLAFDEAAACDVADIAITVVT